MLSRKAVEAGTTGKLERSRYDRQLLIGRLRCIFCVVLKECRLSSLLITSSLQSVPCGYYLYEKTHYPINSFNPFFAFLKHFSRVASYICVCVCVSLCVYVHDAYSYNTVQCVQVRVRMGMNERRAHVIDEQSAQLIFLVIFQANFWKKNTFFETGCWDEQSLV